MKKSIYSSLFILILAFASAVASGQSGQQETRNLKGFSEVSFGVPGNLEIKFGPEFSVVLEGQRSDINEVETEINGDKLIIRQERWGFDFGENVDVYITMPELTALGVSGSGKARISDNIKEADNLTLSVSGSGRLIASGIIADNMHCSISGSGNIVIESSGSADKGLISISGSGSYSGEGFEVDNLQVNVSGSGNCLCKAGDSLKATVSGSGNITYVGDPKIDARISGSGHVRAVK
jgi:hypothetical protein